MLNAILLSLIVMPGLAPRCELTPGRGLSSRPVSGLQPGISARPGADEAGARPTGAALPAVEADETPAAYEAMEIEGFRGRVRSDWLRDRPMEVRCVLAAIKTDMGVIDAVAPGPAMKLLRERVTLWISPSLRPRTGFSGRGMCFHESGGWLEQAGLGAERVRGVEICNADDYLVWRAEQPMMMLHELAHAYHEAMRPDDGAVVEAFERAKAAGSYERVRYVLSGADSPRRAYAMNNPAEYFAELTEAYFGRNDYEPMTREELRAFDAGGCAMVEAAWGNPPARAGAEAAGEPGPASTSSGSSP